MRQLPATIGVNVSRAEAKRGNALLVGSTAKYRDEAFQTPFTLKTVLSGRACYETEDGVHLVEPGDLLVLGGGQRYDLSIKEETEVIALFVSPDALPASLEIPDGRYDARGPAGELLLALRRASHGLSRTQLDPQRFGRALGALEAEAQRAAARLELRSTQARLAVHARLRLARDYLHAHFRENVQIRDAARVACLSTSHFHRNYRLAFGKTPARELDDRRFSEACRLLSTTDRAVTDIVREVGYESLPTFSTRFRQRFGRPPSTWRQFRRIG